ncbi:MAG: agmatinase [Hyphomicrobiaceae bacterium]|nr:agmatinase [Hyphomicrobiaceae bacterium]
MKTRILSPKDGFLGLEASAPPAGSPDARARIIMFGLERSVSYGSGTKDGPAAMIEASHQVELFDEEFWCEPVNDFAVETIEATDIATGGDDALTQLAGLVDDALKSGAFPFVFGGEHAITPGAIRPFVDRHPDLVLLHLDAHADLRDSYDGDRLSHASAIRRCLDAPKLEVVSVGIRNISAEEIPFLEANRSRIHIHWGKDKASWNLDEMLAPLAGRPVYVTFDIDAFDTSLMPATGTPEPGGLFWDDAVKILRAAAARGRIVGCDINELAPIPGQGGYDFVAAKLAYKMLAYRFSRPRA